MHNLDFQKIFTLFQFDKKDPLLFGSSLFLMIFIGLLVVSSLLNKNYKMKFGFLLMFSFYFYYKASGLNVIVLFGTGALTYAIASWMRNTLSSSGRRWILLSGLIVNIGLLFYFKYTNFFLGAIAEFRQQEFTPLDIIMPLGISFYIFKSISYLLEVYWEYIDFEHTFGEFIFYIAFFPGILSGPIDRAHTFIPQLKQNPVFSLTNSDIGKAFFLIMMGLLKKYLIADYIGLNLVDRVFDSPLRFTGVENLIAVYGYTLQIYCDFSGYTDMAIGIALLMGFRLMENFNYPYKAKSVAEFWRRWHISLSSWLSDYIFKPTQMSVRSLSLFGNIIAITLTFLLCGLWHGANWNYILWGGLHALFMSFAVIIKEPKTFIFEKLNLNGSKLVGFIQTVIAFHLIAFSWVIFRMPNIEGVKEVYSQIFTFFRPGVASQFVQAYPVIIILLAAGYLLHFLPQRLYSSAEGIVIKTPMIGKAVLLTLVIWIVSQFRFADMVPFIYFQF